MRHTLRAEGSRTNRLRGLCAVACTVTLATPALSLAAQSAQSEQSLQPHKMRDAGAHNGQQTAQQHNEKGQAANSGGGITKGEVENFDSYLDSHPEVRKDIAARPKLLDDETYLKQHPGLRDFLGSHPGVRQEAKQNPQRFMAREGQYQNREDASANAGTPNSGGGITKGELENFDSFLDTHAGIREQVAKNPRLLSDDKFVDSHPGLRDFLNGHPGVRQEAEQNPQRFMARENQYQKREDAEGRAK